MKVTRFARRSLASAAMPAVAFAVLTGVSSALPSAHAAVRTLAPPATVHLHTVGTVPLGSVGTFTTPDFSEGPIGAVFYSIGPNVYVVNGAKPPVLALTASRKVLAVAANKTELFVETGKTVTGYSRSNKQVLRRWTLASRFRITSAGLIPVGRTVWSWTDWSTDQSGFEFANVNEFSTSSSKVHRISSNNAYPADMAANPAGLYFETVRKNQANGYLVHVTPARTVHRVLDVNVDAPMALAGGRVELLAVHFGNNPHTFLDSYSASTLAHKFSRRVSAAVVDIDATGAGLLEISAACPSRVCSGARISVLNPRTGAASSPLAVPFANVFVAGSHPVVLTEVGGELNLVRLAA
jgi:hypothetical protein